MALPRARTALLSSSGAVISAASRLSPLSLLAQSSMVFKSCLGRSRSAGTSASSPRASSSNEPTSYKYVVLGGGNAAGYVAQAFADKGRGKDELAIVSRDTVPPFERPALSKGFLNASKPARLPGFHTTVGGGGAAHDEAWYKEQGFAWLGEQDVTRVDFKERQLHTVRGVTLKYDKLILATGVEASRLPADKVNDKGGDILYLRSLADAERLTQAIKDHPGGKALVVGGGYIGTEIAAKLLENNLQVTMVFPADRLMDRLFTHDLATVYQRAFEGRGVEFVHASIQTLQHDDSGKVKGAILSDGSEVACDLVVAGIGARPDATLFADHLALEHGGVKVDAHLQSSDENVFAIGDVAAFPLQLEGGAFVRQEHVQHARMSARHVVNVLLAKEDGGADLPAYDYLPYFYSRCLNFNWKFYGINEGTVTHFGTFVEDGKFGALWVRAGQVVGTLLNCGSEAEHDALQAMARERPRAENADEVQALIKRVMGDDVQLGSS